jgi:hypothetical protein
MPLSDIATVNITAQNPGLTLAGFGILLITSASATWLERTRTYNNITGVAGDFATTTVEYQAANAVFAQSPSVPTIMIGRLANKPTQTFTIAIATVVNTAGTPYKVRLNNLSSGAAGAGQGVFATFTTVGADTNDSIVTGLVSAINALALPGVTATATGSVGSKVVTITLSVGSWLGVEVLDIAAGAIGGLMTLTETTADPGITADLTAINTESSVWYGLNILFKSAAIIAAAASFVESNTKLFTPATADTLVATQALGVGSDIAQTLKSASRLRTGVFFHPRNDEFADCAQMGRFFPKNPGSENWRMKSLSGVTTVAFSATQTTNLKAKYCNYYYALSGAGNSNAINVIGGNGLVAFNEYIDVIRFRDWYVATLQTALVNLEYNSDKIPYTDAGISQIENVVRATNTQGISAGGISATGIPQGYTTPGPVVIVPSANSVPTADKTSRTLNNVNTAWVLAGAINNITVNAQVSH